MRSSNNAQLDEALVVEAQLDLSVAPPKCWSTYALLQESAGRSKRSST
jgi:hypothetical protein